MIRTLFLTIGLAGCAEAASVYLVQQILLPPGQFQPMNLSLTNDGRFISNTYNSVTAAFDYLLWDGHSFQSVTSYDDGIRNYFEPAAMNQKAQIIGIAYTGVPSGGGISERNRIPVVRQVDGTFMPLRLPSGAINAFVSAISDTGGVLGVLSIGGQYQPFIWPSLSAEPTPVGAAGNLQAMGGLNIEGTYSLGIANRTEVIVQNGVTHDTGVRPNRFFPFSNNNQTLLEGASADSYFWNGTSVVPLPGLYALALNNEGTILVHGNSGYGLWTNGVVDPLASINTFLASYVINPFYLPTSGLIDDNGRVLLSFGGSTSGSIYLFTPVPDPSSCTPLIMGPHHPCRRR